MRLPSGIRSRRVFSSEAEVSSVIRPVARTVVSELFFSVSSFNSGARKTGLAAIADLLVVRFELNPRPLAKRSDSAACDLSPAPCFDLLRFHRQIRIQSYRRCLRFVQNHIKYRCQRVPGKRRQPRRHLVQILVSVLSGAMVGFAASFATGKARKPLLAKSCPA